MRAAQNPSADSRSRPIHAVQLENVSYTVDSEGKKRTLATGSNGSANVPSTES